MRATLDELTDAAINADWTVPVEVDTALRDPTAWNEDPSAAERTVVGLLAAAHAADPGLLERWLPAILNAAATALPEITLARRIALLVFTAWDAGGDPPAYSEEFFHALLRAVNRLPLHLRPWPPVDIPMYVLNMVLTWATGLNDAGRYLIFLQFVRRLPTPDVVRAIQTFLAPVRSPDGDTT